MSASVLGRSANWIRSFWAREPIIFVSLVMGFAGPAVVYMSPWTKDSIEAMKSIPTSYPYPKIESSEKE